MSRNTTTCLHLPGETDWETWEKGKRTERDPSGAWLHCFEARAIFTVPLWIRSTENERIGPIVRMQMESHGLAGGEPAAGRHLDYWIVARNGTRTQVLAMWLPEDREEDGWLIGPSGFAVTPQLFRFPRDTVMLWRELDRWVIAFTKGERPAYFQTLSNREVDSDLISEIRCLKETMELNGFVGDLAGMEIADDRLSEASARRLEDALDLPVSLTPRAIPTPPRNPARLLPSAVALRRQSVSRQNRLSRFLLVGAVVYFAAAAWFIGNLYRDSVQNRKTRQWIDLHLHEADAAKIERERWEFLKPAVDRDRFPIEIFHRIVSLLPEEGVRLTHFEVDLDAILVRGEASSSTEAISWKNRLLKTAEAGGLFEGCRWTFPQPDILPDNRATFSAEGNWNPTTALP